jgi:hypothetical protein
MDYTKTGLKVVVIMDRRRTGWVEDAITLALMKEVESESDRLQQDGLFEVYTRE